MKYLNRLKQGSAGIGQGAQTILELMFAIIVILFLLFGLVKASRWSIIDMVDRRARHDSRLQEQQDGLYQLNPSTYRVRNPDLEYRATAIKYTW